MEAKKNSMRKDRARKYIQSGPPCRSAADKEYLSFTSSLRLSEFADKMRYFNPHCIALFVTLHFARGMKSFETHKTNTTNDTGTSIDLQDMFDSRGEICHCRHCRRQCKFFASSVNVSIFTHFLVFLSPKLLKFSKSKGVKFLA